jgi:hypothetical protein
MLDCARKIIAAEGIGGLYRYYLHVQTMANHQSGLLPNLIGVSPEKAIP